MDSVDWREIKMRVENKRHTNTDQPLTSHSTTEVSIPPPPLYTSRDNSIIYT
jgi:hypothetical protein